MTNNKKHSKEDRLRNCQGHTPGPWKILPHTPEKAYLRIRGTRLGGKHKIADVYGVEGTNPPIMGEAHSNANLMAAAPEMYESLKALLVLEYGPNYDAREKDWRAAVAKARETINRVEREH